MTAQILGYYGLAVLVGVLSGIHVPINGALGARIDSTLVATFAFYGVAFLLISAACLIARDRDAFVALTTVPYWYYIAGVISLIVIASSTFLIPRIGAVHLFVIVFSLQMIARVVISHFGWLESPVSPISLVKVAGCVLLLAGAVLVVRN